MNETLRTKNSNIKIISFMVIISLFVFSLSGCQQINDAINSNKATNTNTTANSNATANTNANANSNANINANSNANANTSSAVPTNSAANTNSQASNTAAAKKEEVPLTPEAKAFKNTLVGTWENESGLRTTFTEDKVRFGSNPETTYKLVDEKTVEFTWNGTTTKATMTFEDNGNTMIWVESGMTYRCKRLK